MQIIAHRGYWKYQTEKNKSIAFNRALSSGFGIETDIRDHQGKLVICHDIPNGVHMSCEDFFALYKKEGNAEILALNIKSDGLQKKLGDLIKQYNIINYFVFDMSIPDTLGFITLKMKLLSRHSNFEPHIPFEDFRAGVWCDSFNDNAASMDIALKEIQQNRVGILVSPELHSRPHEEAWVKWKRAYDELDVTKRDLLMICTDIPDVAQKFFRGYE